MQFPVFFLKKSPGVEAVGLVGIEGQSWSRAMQNLRDQMKAVTWVNMRLDPLITWDPDKKFVEGEPFTISIHDKHQLHLHEGLSETTREIFQRGLGMIRERNLNRTKKVQRSSSGAPQNTSVNISVAVDNSRRMLAIGFDRPVEHFSLPSENLGQFIAMLQAKKAELDALPPQLAETGEANKKPDPE